MRLIDADAMLDDVLRQNETIKALGIEELTKMSLTICDGIKQEICNQPTIDAVEVVHGEWIKSDDGTECSCCGFALEDWIQGVFYNFCPNCGAIMHNPCADCQEFDCYGCEYKNGARR